MGKNIIDNIMQVKDVLPKKQRILCDYIVLNYTEVGMMTVAELADASGVGTTTVMRLIKLLAYDNYSEFKHDLLQYSLQNKTSSYSNIKEGFKSIINNPNSDIITKTCYEAIHTIENFITPKNIAEISKAVKLMTSCESINVLGLRSSKAVALYFEYMIDRFYPKIKQFSTESEFLYDKAFRVKDGDLLVVFSVWPCTKKTIDIADICKERNIPIILITNTTLNPIARYADVVIDTNSVNSSLVNLPAMFIVEALAAELGKAVLDEATKNIENLEKNLDKCNVFIWDSKR